MLNSTKYVLFYHNPATPNVLLQQNAISKAPPPEEADAVKVAC